MPEQQTIERARKDKRAGKAASTQAGEFVREEMEHIRQGKHGARSTRQAIAIGLSKARRAGVELKPPAKGTTSEKTRRSAVRAYARGHGAPARAKSSAKRSRATTNALKREGRAAASPKALAKQARTAAGRRSRSRRSASTGKRAVGNAQSTRKWSAGVMARSDALDLESGVFKARDPRQVALSLKHSAEASQRRKSTPFRSAMSMLNFEINRAGRNLSAERRRVLNQAKVELRKIFHREPARQ
jgi:hypothetical protein